MRTTKYYWLFIMTLTSFSAFAQIPDPLKSNWANSGIDSSFFIPSTVLDINSFGGIPNDGLDDHAALINAMAALPVGGAVIYFHPGTYNFSSSIYVPSYCILKGSGADSTFFVFDIAGAVSNCFNFIGIGTTSYYPISSGLNRGSNAILVAGADTMFTQGDLVEIREQNGTWDTNPASWAGYSVGHVTSVDSLHADTVFMHEAFRINFDASLSPEIRRLSCIENSGIECLRFTRVDSLAPSINYGIYFLCAYNCLVSGVESYKSIGAHVLAEISAHLTIRQSYFHEAYTYDGSNTRGYGVIMAIHTSAARIENNIFQKLRHAMMVKQGANGNVFGYNYSFQTIRTEFPSNASGDICLHGHYPFANLFEGNICQNVAIDQAWGPSGPYNALFRNRIELYGLIFTSGTVQSDHQLLAGNDIPNTTFLQGNYIVNGSNHYQQANRVQGVVTPSGTNTLPDTSLYLTNKPDYWRNVFNFPSIGIPALQATNQLPAASRYLQGNDFAPCAITPDSSTTFISEQALKTDIEIISLTYEHQSLNVYLSTEKPEELILSIVDLNGKNQLSKPLNASGGNQLISVKFSAANGLYFLNIEKGSERISNKFVIINQ